MHPSSRLLVPGFAKRSLDEFKRLSNIGSSPTFKTGKLIEGPFSPMVIVANV